MFKLPKAEEDGPEEGSSPEHPIVMKGVAASDFAALLTFLYANPYVQLFGASETPFIIAEEHLDDIDKIVFATEFDIKEWLAPAHIRLCQDKKLSA
ncbi:BTB domain protein, partial [Rhizoctonia solani AG-3 Rhs1AP]